MNEKGLNIDYFMKPANQTCLIKAAIWSTALFLNPFTIHSLMGQNSMKPNVLFLAVDDLNDWLTLYDKHNPIRTPNLQRLAARGAFFTKAYCSSPSCNPSRASLLTGTRPHKTGIYGNKTDWRAALPNALTIQQYFMKNGYYSAGAGKIFHHHWDGAFSDSLSFNEFLQMPKVYPDYPIPQAKLNGLEWYGSKNTDWGAWPPKEEDAVDFRTASYAEKFLTDTHNSPFILSIGIFRPHMPFYSPEAWINKYDKRKQTVMPPINPTDWDDLPTGAVTLMKSNAWFWQGMEKALKEDSGAYHKMVAAYQAAAAYADHQIGRVIDALDRSPYKDNTIIVLWSDHGYHIGEKQHIEKFALWEKSTHIPFIWVAPGKITPGMVIHTPVDLTTVYPTLLELAGLPVKKDLDGRSLVPLFKNTKAFFPPALMTYLQGNHAVRTDRWRYIRYADGTSELYDHWTDLNEWKNLAGDKTYAKIIDSLQKFIPEKSSFPAPDMEMPAWVKDVEYKQ